MPTQVNVRFDIQQISSTQIKLFEQTGEYNSVSNTLGWDDGNHLSGQPALSDILLGELSVEDPDNVITTTTVLGAGLLYDNTLPPINLPNTPFTYSVTVVGKTIGEQFDDGLHTFILQVDGQYPTPTDAFTAAPSVKKFFTWQSECCIEKMFVNNKVWKSIGCSPCEQLPKAVCNAMNGYTWLKAIEYAANAGRYETAQTILEILNSICAECGCNC